MLPWTKALAQWRERVIFLRSAEGDEWPDLSDEALAATAEEWLAPHLVGQPVWPTSARSRSAMRCGALLPWNLQRRLDAEAPTHVEVPTGSQIADRLWSQARARFWPFGCRNSSVSTSIRRIAGGRVPLILHLLSPAQRPIQITRDLPGFWRGSWAAVQADMRGQYPSIPGRKTRSRRRPTRRAKAAGNLRLEARDEPVGGGPVERHRDVVDEADAHQRLHVDVVRVGRERIDEEEQHVDLAFGDHGADLLVAAERSAFQTGHRQSGQRSITRAPVVPVANNVKWPMTASCRATKSAMSVFLGVMGDERQGQFFHCRSVRFQLFQRSRHCISPVKQLARRSVLDALESRGSGRREISNLQQDFRLDGVAGTVRVHEPAP